MKIVINILLSAFYSLGTFCLPLGDFSVLQDIPEMYRHCNATEDKDMTPFDFFTDHLVNIDGVFDKHENGDEQKPHTPTPTQFHGQMQIPLTTYFTFSIITFHPTEVKPTIPIVNSIQSNYISKILRPPIV